MFMSFLHKESESSVRVLYMQNTRINMTCRAYLHMPLVKVSMYPGRTRAQKDEFAKELTESAVRILGTKKEHVIVVFDENPKENWFLAGEQL